MFRNLVDLSELPITPTSKKFMLLSKKQRKGITPKFSRKTKKQNGGIIVMGNLDDLIDRLRLIIASIQAGNSSTRLQNELSEITDKLLLSRVLTKVQHANIFNKYVDK